MSLNTIIFDQFSRYKACADFLSQTNFVKGNSVLDIGSGPECLLGQFIPDATMNYVDPLIPDNSTHRRISGTIFSKELDGQYFDCVSAIDVLEHIPPSQRQAFLERMSSLGKHTLILGFPTIDASEASKTDKAINDQYNSSFGTDYSWLEEHFKFGLPSLTETVNQLNQLGWHCQTAGHGHAPWLKKLLGFVVCIWDIHSLSDVVFAASEKFNRDLYASDFNPPCYRQFVIATRQPLPPITLPTKNDLDIADKIFQTLINDTYQHYLATSLQQLVKLQADNLVLEKSQQEVSTWATSLQVSAEEVSAWAKSLQITLAERDEQIRNLSLEIENFNIMIDNLNREIFNKQVELNRLNGYFVNRAETFIRHHMALLRKILARSFVGDVVRYMRDSRRCRQNQVPLASIKQSVLDMNGNLIITFPIITWDFRWQRPQHIVSRLRDRGYSVLYVAMSLSPLGRKLRSNNDALGQINFNELAPFINQIWLNSNKPLNVYVDPIEDDDLYNISMEMNALINEMQPKSIIYLIQFPNWAPIAREMQNKWGGKIVFDCMDDHGGFSTNSTQALKTEKDLIEYADLVITSSDLLEERAKSINPKTIQVKNGTEFEHFKNPAHNGQLDHLSDRPIIGYYGAISDWFDMELLAYCAKRHTDWNFVLIGATTGADLHLIDGLKNIYLLGEKPYKDLPGHLAYFDVCTIPFKIIPLTLSTNPVKFYEYISAGKPVVSVDLPELHAYKDHCYLAHNPDEFLAQIEKAYNERQDKIKIANRLNLASENSWDARVDIILKSEIFQTNPLQN